jgi:hypothetical protein
MTGRSRHKTALSLSAVGVAGLRGVLSLPAPIPGAVPASDRL